jgi:lactoylglutathione lyase
MTGPLGVSELRLVVTVDDYDAAVAFYRDVLGLTEAAEYIAEGEGRVIILEAGRATLELTDLQHAEHIDAVEVGQRVAGKYRVAFQVTDSAAATRTLAAHGVEVIGEPTRTPWNSLNARLDGPGGLQLTLFEDLSDRGTSTLVE